MSALLEIKNLTVSFGGGTNEAPAVRNISFSVEKGSFTSLVGESGSGKSVTALSLTGLSRAQVEGHVYFDRGRTDILSLSGESLRAFRGREVGYVFQDPASALNPVLTVKRQLLDVISAHDALPAAEALKRAEESLRSVRLADTGRILASYAHELSGGMKQRVQIAMALLPGPRLLVADEPTTALDVSTETEILKLVSSLKAERGLTILFITHNLPLAMRHSDKIAVMEKGRIVETFLRGASPAENYSKKLFSASLIGVKPKTRIEV